MSLKKRKLRSKRLLSTTVLTNRRKRMRVNHFRKTTERHSIYFFIMQSNS